MVILLSLEFVDQLNLADGSVRRIVPFQSTGMHYVVSQREPLWSPRSDELWIDGGKKWVIRNNRPIVHRRRDWIISQVTKFNIALEQLNLTTKDHEDLVYSFAKLCDTRGAGVRYFIEDDSVWVRSGQDDGDRKTQIWP